jgi:hypothetical protein
MNLKDTIAKELDFPVKIHTGNNYNDMKLLA